MMCSGKVVLELEGGYTFSSATVVPVDIEDIYALTTDHISQIKWNEILLNTGLVCLNRSDVRTYRNEKLQGVFFQSKSNPQWTIVLSEGGGSLKSLYFNALTWRKRDGTWSVEFEFPQTEVEDENYYIAMHFKKCYPHPETQRIMTDQRDVRVMREDSGKLKFFQQGEPLPFEDVEQYKAKRLTDRLTSNYLLKCAKRLGVDLLEEVKQVKPENCYSFAELEPKQAQSVVP